MATYLSFRRNWGRARRLFLLAMIVIGLLALLGMAMATPGMLAVFIAITLLAALAGATQDVVVDAYRIEIAPPEAQGALAATYTLGYRLALLVSGALALFLADHVSWSQVYQVMAMVPMRRGKYRWI